MASPLQARKSHQPLHPSIRPRLDPDYVTYHDAFVQYIVPDDTKPWSPAIRAGTTPPLPYSGIGPVAVASTTDVELETCTLRVFVPQGSHEGSGWPAILWFHGGGFAQGGVESDHDFLTRLCAEARCVVVTVGYRLAPENPYPACLRDAEAAARWLSSVAGGRKRFDVDVSRLAIGGTSSGGLLSLVTAMSCAAVAGEAHVPFVFQLLVCPVVDNTATEDSPTWSEIGAASPWLTPARMLWYRRMWLPGWTAGTELEWDASPNLATGEMLRRLPKTWMGIPECDLLAPEGLALGARMREEGVSVETVVYEGCPHPIITLPGRMGQSRKLFRDTANALKDALWATR